MVRHPPHQPRLILTLVPAGVEATFDVTLMQNVYILRDAVSGTLNFQFATV